MKQICIRYEKTDLKTTGPSPLTNTPPHPNSYPECKKLIQGRIIFCTGVQTLELELPAGGREGQVTIHLSHRSP